MSTITVQFDNSANSPENNPPGSKLWIGGSDVHGAPGTLVDKIDTLQPYTMDASVTSLNTWYYDGYAWNSGVQLNGPFTDNQVIVLLKVKL